MSISFDCPITVGSLLSYRANSNSSHAYILKTFKKRTNLNTYSSGLVQPSFDCEKKKITIYVPSRSQSHQFQNLRVVPRHQKRFVVKTWLSSRKLPAYLDRLLYTCWLRVSGIKDSSSFLLSSCMGQQCNKFRSKSAYNSHPRKLAHCSSRGRLFFGIYNAHLLEDWQMPARGRARSPTTSTGTWYTSKLSFAILKWDAPELHLHSNRIEQV